MNPDSAASRITNLVADMAHLPSHAIDAERWLPDYGIDSLGIVMFRERLERRLPVHVPDEVWPDFRSIADLIVFVEGRLRSSGIADDPPSGVEPPAAPLPGADSRMTEGIRLTPSGLLVEEIEIGMPLTGMANLAEGPLLKHLGDLRWKQMSALCGVPSRRIVDAEGDRLYPTFFYVEMAFPDEKPMAAYGENDRVKIVSTLRRFGGAMLDGISFLFPADGSPESDEPPFDGLESARAGKVPAVRLSNIFVKQFAGAEWLRKSRPAVPGFRRIPESEGAPDCQLAVKQAEKEGRFSDPPDGFVPMTDGPVRVEYRLVPDRDLNGAGLVYFANYPVFLDICEREVLASAGRPLTDDLIDRRTLVRRRSAYLNNASSRDTLVVEIEPWVEAPAAGGAGEPGLAPIRLFVNARMFRRSDGRLMMVSTAEKTVFGGVLEDLPFYGSFRA
jgi:probable biosynthetic protein (TIGR04098 family)